MSFSNYHQSVLSFYTFNLIIYPCQFDMFYILSSILAEDWVDWLDWVTTCLPLIDRDAGVHNKEDDEDNTLVGW